MATIYGNKVKTEKGVQKGKKSKGRGRGKSQRKSDNKEKLPDGDISNDLNKLGEVLKLR